MSLLPVAASVQSSEVYFPVTSMGTDVGDPLSIGPGTPGAYYGYGPYLDGPQSGPSGLWTGLGVSVSFSLSGDSDIAALTGFAQVQNATVPDGGTGLVGALALAALVLASRRVRG